MIHTLLSSGGVQVGEDLHGLVSGLPLRHALPLRGAVHNEPALLAFSRFLCEELPHGPVLGAASYQSSPLVGAKGGRDELHRFCSAVLYECLTQEKAEMIVAYLRLYRLTLRLPHAPHACGTCVASARQPQQSRGERAAGLHAADAPWRRRPARGVVRLCPGLAIAYIHLL